MATGALSTSRPSGDVPQAATSLRLHIPVLGMSLGLFLAIGYALCVALGLWWPAWGLHQPWLQFLPGFTWLTWPSFLLGLAESFAYGWFFALIFAPLYNFFTVRWAP